MRPADPSFLDLFDALLLDMDGTLIHGSRPIEHASEAIAAARERDIKISFATNNASRTPDMVVEHLSGVGISAFASEVVNSPMVASALLKDKIPSGATVLAVGGEGLVHELQACGYVVVREASRDVAAVVQGFAPDVAWKDLAEAAYAINNGAYFVATNIDSTLPTEKGLAPGNGSLVLAVRNATGVAPVAAGKPEPAMFTVASERAGSLRPLAVGDRLDTDLEGGNRAGIPTLQVLTGVSSWLDAANADPVRRPTFVRPNMSYLAKSAAKPVIDGKTAHLGSVRATLEGNTIVVRGETHSWQTPQVVISLVNSRFPEQVFDGDVISGESSGLFPAFAR